MWFVGGFIENLLGFAPVFNSFIPPSIQEQIIFLGKQARHLSTDVTFKQRRYNCGHGGNDGNDHENTDDGKYFINERSMYRSSIIGSM